MFVFISIIGFSIFCITETNVLLSLSVCAEQISLSFIILTYYVILPNCTAKCAFEKTVINTQHTNIEAN